MKIPDWLRGRRDPEQESKDKIKNLEKGEVVSAKRDYDREREAKLKLSKLEHGAPVSAHEGEETLLEHWHRTGSLDLEGMPNEKKFSFARHELTYIDRAIEEALEEGGFGNLKKLIKRRETLEVLFDQYQPEEDRKKALDSTESAIENDDRHTEDLVAYMTKDQETRKLWEGMKTAGFDKEGAEHGLWMASAEEQRNMFAEFPQEMQTRLVEANIHRKKGGDAIREGLARAKADMMSTPDDMEEQEVA